MTPEQTSTGEPPSTGPSDRYPAGPDPSAPRLRYMPGLDGVRGFAVLAVLLFHAGHWNGAFMSVEAFMALSGFLITSLLLSEFGRTGSIGLGAFWGRRVRRLIPGLLFMLAGVALYAAFFAEAEELERIRRDALATLGYVANWNAVVDGHDYWELFAAPSPLEHAWTLAIEEQFYLIWPLACAGLFLWLRWTPRALFRLCIVLSLAAAAWMRFLYTPGGSTQRVYVGTDTRAIAIFAGAALACLLAWKGETRTKVGRNLLEAAGIISLGVLAWVWIAADGQSPAVYRGGFLLHAVPMVIVIAAAAHSRPGPVGWALSFKPFVWAGLISYGLYLWHWPLYVFLSPDRTGLDGYALTAVRLAASIGVAVFSYHVIEMPVRRGAFRGWRIQALAPATAVAVAVLLVVVTVGSPTSTRLSFEDTAAAAAEQAKNPAPPPPPPDAALAEGDAPPRIMIVGDSLAWYIGEAIVEQADDSEIVAFNTSLPGCIFAPGGLRHRATEGGETEVRQGTECSKHWQRVIEEFSPDLTVAILAAPARADIEVGDAWLEPCQDNWAAWFEAMYSSALDDLRADGSEVVLTHATGWSKEVAGPNAEEKSRRDWINGRIDCLNESIDEIVDKEPGPDVIDIEDFFCSGGECTEEVDGVPLRPDGVHFEGEGAALVAEWLVPQLVELIPAPPPPSAETAL